MPIFLALSSTRKKVTALERNSYHGALWLSPRKWGDKDTGLERGTDGTTQRATSLHSLRMRESLKEKGFQAERTVDTFYRLRTDEVKVSLVYRESSRADSKATEKYCLGKKKQNKRAP